jgi:hypothetical protein
MSRAIPTHLIQSLRHELAAAISDYKAYDVPSVCARLGLAEGDEEEAFNSKYKYASKRLTTIPVEPLIAKARLLLEEIDAFQIAEAVEKIADLERPQVTTLTRRRLIKLLADRPLVSEVEEYAFLSAVLPLKKMPSPSKNDGRTL